MGANLGNFELGWWRAHVCYSLPRRKGRSATRAAAACTSTCSSSATTSGERSWRSSWPPQSRPAEEPLGSYVRGSQVDRSSESKWPVYDGPGGWDELADALRLTHTREDDELGLRAFCMDVMDGVPCHQDWQTSDGEALLLAYVTKYVAKFSDAAYDEWFNDDASADCVARRVCFEYHPLEPEMVLQLSGALFRQYRMSTVSGGFRAISAPWPGMEVVPEFVNKYAACKWRGEEMSLLEWLRKTTNEGQVGGWLKQKHQEEILKRAHTRHLECGGALEVKAFRKALLTQYRVKRRENDAPSFVQATYEFLQQNGTPMTEGAQDYRSWICSPANIRRLARRWSPSTWSTS